MDEASVSTDELKMQQFMACAKSWFGRHRSTEYMQQGSRNETFIAQRLAQQPWVSSVFNVGMLQSKLGAEWIAVSPDAIILADLPHESDENEKQVLFVEMKTRQTGKTISGANEAVQNYGQLVFCKYDDDIFKGCVPASNRKQLLHQAMVTNLKYGLFVTAVAFDNESEVIQYVVVEFSHDLREDHYMLLKTVGEPLVGWLYDKELLSRGYLKKGDCPTWMSDEDINDCISHFPMWSALYNRVVLSGRNDDTSTANNETDPDVHMFHPMNPISVFKHYQQFEYNRSKWGLDKNTEMSDHVFMLGLKVSFEAHYILRMICGVVVNTWRVAQARRIVQFLKENNEDNARTDPTVAQMRRQCENLTLNDFVLQLGIETLKFLQSSRFRQYNPLAQNPFVNVSAEDQLTEDFKKFKEEHPWPVKRRKLEVFSEHPTLTRLRKFSSSSYQHMKVNINDVDPTKNRKKCALCAKGNMKYRQTSFMCNLCEVPLCARQYGKRKNNESCFQLWHNSENLMDVHKQAHDSIIRAKASDDDKLGDDNDESSTYSVDDSDIQQVPALPRIEGNIDSQEVPELPMIEGDIVTQQASELTRIEGV